MKDNIASLDGDATREPCEIKRASKVSDSVMKQYEPVVSPIRKDTCIKRRKVQLLLDKCSRLQTPLCVIEACFNAKQLTQ